MSEPGPGNVENTAGTDPATPELRDRIAECAFGLFREKGYTEVRTEDVAKSLHISKKTIYKIFRSKEELLEAGIELQAARIAGSKPGGDQKTEKVSALSELFETYFVLMDAFPQKLETELMSAYPPAAGKIAGYRREWFRKPFADAANLLKASGKAEFSPDGEALATTLEGMTAWLVTEARGMEREITGLVLRGLRKRKEKKGKKKRK